MTILKAAMFVSASGKNTLTFDPTIAIMYVTFPAAIQAELSAFLTTEHVTYTQKFNGNMRGKERRKVTAKNERPLKSSTN